MAQVGFIQVAGWLAEDQGLWPRQRAALTPATRVTHDIGCTGADGDEMLHRFCLRFGIPVEATNLDTAKHYPPEGDGFMLGPLLRRLGWAPPAPRGFYPITIADLVQAANSGTFHYDYERRVPV